MVPGLAWFTVITSGVVSRVGVSGQQFFKRHLFDFSLSSLGYFAILFLAWHIVSLKIVDYHRHNHSSILLVFMVRFDWLSSVTLFLIFFLKNKFNIIFHSTETATLCHQSELGVGIK